MMLFTIFVQFVQYGLLCFGGGYMIIPLLYADIVQNIGIMTAEQYGNLLAVSQITPGAVSINTATYVGYLQSGLLGAVVATVGLCMPTFILSIFFLQFLEAHKQSLLVTGFLKGIKWVAFIMILLAIVLFAKISVIKVVEADKIQINPIETGITLLTVLLSRKIPFTLLLLISALIGFAVNFLE